MRLPVLYVEDNAVNVLIMEALFERRPGLRLVVACTLAEALAEALEQACDLYPVWLLLDLRLPDGDGRALLPILRRVPGCETAPAVEVTAEIALQTALSRVGGTYPMHEVPRLLAIFSQRLVRPPH